MFSWRTPFRGLLLLATSLSVLGQESGARYEALKQALGLSDNQISQLRETPAPIRIYTSARAVPGPTGGSDTIKQPMQSRNSRQDRILDESQRVKLAAIQKILDRWDAAALAIRLGLISEQQWPGRSFCLSYPIPAYASYAYVAELALTSFQILQFEQIERASSEPLWAQVREKDIQRSMLLTSGVSADSPVVVQLGLDIDKLQAQVNARPRHDLALAVLDATQKSKLAAFDAALRLASEAIEIGLISVPLKGEIQCH